MTVSFSRSASITKTCAAIEDTGARLAALMRQIDDPTPIAVGEWSIGDTAHHVADSVGYFLGTARGEIAPERLDEVDAGNAQLLADDPERDPRTLADRFEHDTEALVNYARTVAGDPPVHAFEGIEVPLSTLLGVELGERLVHGFDIARAAGLPWHIDQRHAVLTHQAYLPLLPHLLDAQRAADTRLRLALHIRGMDQVVIVIEHARLQVADGSLRPVDAHLVVDPVSYLLLSWRRIGQLRPMLTGKLVVWGRRPWRAGALQTLLNV